MTSDFATLGAAAVAAAASFLNLLISAGNRRREGNREAVRVSISRNLDRVGRLVHEVIALSYILAKNENPDLHKEKHERAKGAADKLKDLRLDVRYSLWGIEEGLRTLTRVPDWVAHTKSDIDRQEKLLQAASSLGLVLDDVIRKTYFSGTHPNIYSRWRVKRKAAKVRSIFDAFN
ncbi:hypothetical protein FHS78_002665 [Parvibaculum indicum]|uniref:hypothetical protein n=1 Tax=Parvibaculum indicum TaxID=562969 RepID=UPI0014203DC2|nr:hypothetical protein [Parvibaculum indicum]NIJ42371.1 hypothetical protein [Parvibaculum indicum]